VELSAGELGMDLLMKSKKGAGFLEVNYVFTGVLFFFLFGLSLNLVLSEADIEEKSFNNLLEDMTEEMGAIAGSVISVIIGVGSFIFSLFGVSLISAVGVLPLWLNSFLALYSIFITVFMVSWFITWIGNVIPFT